jgi:hypothetical protein
MGGHRRFADGIRVWAGVEEDACCELVAEFVCGAR